MKIPDLVPAEEPNRQRSKNKSRCQIIREKIDSGDPDEFIGIHIADCEQCRVYYQKKKAY